MAEVRQCFGRGRHDFAHKICKRYLPESQKKQGQSTANEEFSPPEKTRVNIVPRYRSYAAFWRASFSSSARPCGRGLGPFAFTRSYSGNGTGSEPLYKTKTGYYEILEVSPTATQAQIKTAYYKQSFLYHPDRNSGSAEATVRFSEVSEAHTVLGNTGLRKKYDRGLLSKSDLTATTTTAAAAATRPSGGGSAKRHTGGRQSVAGVDDREGIFDFDAFFKSHYNDQLQKQRDIRVRKEEMLKNKEETIGDKKMGKMMEIGVGMLLVLAMGIILNSKQ
ncbi:dnaJ homolog subfamily C member 30, mitochondrial-like [Embiotoca jacksoni]|uniref:dnaJ homolog subfamily C member 30, mitochondrial-like n=1 Tax=Embiotoca jacksoni TaxID=100190 RepID=UPI003703A7BD